MFPFFLNMKIFIGFILIVVWALLIRFRFQIRDFTGDWDWAIRYLGARGTTTAIVLIGMLIIAMGAAYPFGAFDDMNEPIRVTTPARP